MGYVLAFLSQKGGVGKSTLARILAVEMAKAGLSVKIADLDNRQTTSYLWAQRRAERGHEPKIEIDVYENVNTALTEALRHDVLIVDGAGHASRDTRIVAKAADLVVLPTGICIDDLYPTVLLAHDLRKEGLPKERIRIALGRITDSGVELRATRKYLGQSGYNVLPGELPFRTAYAKATDQGLAFTETPFRTLNKRAEEVAQGIVDAMGSIAATGRAAVA